MKKIDFKLVNKQHALNQLAIEQFKLIKYSDDFDNLPYHQRIFINQILLKNKDLMQTLNDEGLLKADRINEKLWKEKSGWDYDSVDCFLHLSNLITQTYQLLRLELDEQSRLGRFSNSHVIEQINSDNLVIKNLIDQDEIISFCGEQLNPLLMFCVYENFYRIVLKVNDKKAYLIIDLDLRVFDKDKILMNNVKQAINFINQGLDQLRVFINQCVVNKSEHEWECNISRMTINYDNYFDKPLVKIFWNWDYDNPVKNWDDEDKTYHLLIDEHEPYQDCLIGKTCADRILNCLYDNGIYQGQRLIDTGLNFQLVKNNHYGYKVVNFNTESVKDYHLLWKFPAFYQVVKGQEFIVIDPQWLREQVIIGSTWMRRRWLEPSLLKNYLIGVYVGDCDNVQAIQGRLDEISNDCKWNDLVQGWDFNNSFDKLEILALKEDQ